MNRNVATLGHIIPNRANQSVLLLLNSARLSEKQQILIIVFGLIRPYLKSTIYHIRGEYANHYTTDAVHLSLKLFTTYG
jgi:uroporphyrinogen-III synthase